MEFSDGKLIERVRQKDKEAFVAIFEKYKDKIFRYLYGYLRDYERAREFTLDTFMKAYSCIDQYQERGKFSSWLYAIARNKAKREIENRSKHKIVSLDAAVYQEGAVALVDLIEDNRQRPDYRARVKELEEAVYDVLDKLDEKYREALILCDMEGLSYIEAAKIVNTNPITIGTRVRRARKMFYDQLKRYKKRVKKEARDEE